MWTWDARLCLAGARVSGLGVRGLGIYALRVRGLGA